MVGRVVVAGRCLRPRESRETDGCCGPPPDLQSNPNPTSPFHPATTDSRPHPPTVKFMGLPPCKLQRNYATRAREGDLTTATGRAEPSRFLRHGSRSHLVSRLHAGCVSRHRGGFAFALPRDLPVSPAARARHDTRNGAARAVPRP